jgi:hypothetical protein
MVPWHRTGDRGDEAISQSHEVRRPISSCGALVCCIAGQTTEEWAIRDGKKPAEAISILRCSLAALAHYYG